MRSLRRFVSIVSSLALAPLALVSMGTLGDCSPHMPVGSDDAGAPSVADSGRSPAVDAAAVDAATAVDAAVAPVDSGTSMPDSGIALPPELRLDEAARICGLVSACLHGQIYLEPCILALARPLTGAGYRDAAGGRAFTHFATSGSGAGFPPHDDPVPLPSIAAEPSTRACLTSATTCDDVFRCMNGGAASPACTPGATETRCDGAVVRACLYTEYAESGFPPEVTGSAPRAMSLDCTLQGNGCVVGPDGASVPFAGCASAACDATSWTPRCEGDVAVNCFRGGVDRTSCGPARACRVSPTQATCAGTGGACDRATTPTHCEGSTLVSCDEGGLVRTDCSAAGLGCVTIGAGNAMCGLGSECEIFGPATCDASTGVIHACYLGRSVPIDCHALGYATCGSRFLWAEPFCQ